MPHAPWLSAVATLGLGLLVASASFAADAVKFATNWRAQAEHGGFYQALVDGTYQRYGLDVTIVPGGPLVNNRAQLVVGRVDFLMGSNLVQAFDAVKQRLPTVVVAACFQRDAQCLLAHPEAGYETLADLRSARLLIGNAGRQGYFRWLQGAHGFSADRVRPYTFNLAPFLADPKLVQQGLVTAEPLAIRNATGQEPQVFLLADSGWATYATLIETRRELVTQQPDLVRRFVDASAEGWYRYMYGDPTAANARIRQDNPDMSPEQLDYSRGKLVEYGIVDSGDAIERGIGVVTRDRVTTFYDSLVAAKVFAASEIDPLQAVDPQFTGHGVGLDVKRSLTDPATSATK